MMVFLDIDGVMVPAKSWKTPEFLDDGFPTFSNQASEALQNFISTDDIIMLTTTHRERFGLEEWKRIFLTRGVILTKIQILPENKGNLNRKDELIHWFKNNPNKIDFIIIDDDKSLNELPLAMKKNLVQTRPLVGLTKADLSQVALRRLV